MAAVVDEMTTNDRTALMAAPGDDANAQRSGWRSWRLNSVFTIVAVFLTSCALLHVYLNGFVSGNVEVPAKTKAIQEKAQKIQNTMKDKLRIEHDLGDFVPDSLPVAVRPGSGANVKHAAARLFQNVMLSSGLQHELSDNEQQAFEDRFVYAMANAEHPSHSQYMATVRRKIEGTKPVMTSALAKAVNERQSGFKVSMHDWMVDISKDEYYNSMMGRAPRDENQDTDPRTHKNHIPQTMRGSVQLPTSFDSRDKWPACADVIGHIHNQGNCGSCWVFGAMGPLDSRLCISTLDQNSAKVYNKSLDILSRGFGASCVPEQDGCKGGWEYWIYVYIGKGGGIPTESCDPYFAGDNYADHWSGSMPAPACPTDCDARYVRHLPDDYFNPTGVEKYTLVLDPDDAAIEQMKQAMYEGGPVAFGVYADSVFMGYSGGIFDNNCAKNANHAVHAIGWGEDDGCDNKKGCKYILGQNSWGTGWGLQGRMKVGYCVPTDFTIPGPITHDAGDYPLPVPTGTQTTSTTLPPDVTDNGACQYDSTSGCYTSPNFPSDYGTSQECHISYKIGKIDVVSFDTEEGYDYLEINDERYSGSDGPQDVVPRTNLYWKSDSSVVHKGWKICPQ